MAQPGRQRPGGIKDRRARNADTGSAPGRRSPALSADALAEIADELEEHGRALIERARQLRRSAARSGEQATGRGREDERAPRGRGAPRSRGEGGARKDAERERGGRAGGAERKRAAGDPPDWAPKPRRKRG